jgi:hypothetical protein
MATNFWDMYYWFHLAGRWVLTKMASLLGYHHVLEAGSELLTTTTIGSVLRWYRWSHILAGWLLTTLAVAGFTGLVRKD